MNRDTPKEVKFKSEIENEKWDYQVECPECGDMVFMGNYCSTCGQRLTVNGSIYNLPSRE